MMWKPTLGAVRLEDGRTQFRLWAPKLKRVQLHIVEPEDRVIEMEPEDKGYFQTIVEHVEPGTRYFFRVKGHNRPDPASHFQPDGVTKASAVVSTDFDWHDGDWQGIPKNEYIFYELHVGTFTPEGTFDAIIPRLDMLKALGITAIELMPIAEFPGERNWGYDGVYPYAPQSSYGGPDGLRRLVDACHQRGLAIVLDVVYNHFGPEGNYTTEYGEYFTDAYTSAWGSALNFDQAKSDEVRRLFIENALYWFTEFHIDSLRLDSTHTIMDFSAHTFLQQLAEEVGYLKSQLRRKIYLIAENAKNDGRTTRPLIHNGLGMDAQWCDDFHHALRTLLTGDRNGYYQDYGTLAHLVKAFREGFYFSGQYSTFLQRHYGTNATDVPGECFVVYTHNHDQVGNRAFGERLAEFLSFDELKLAAGVMLLSPYLPLLFMGEEYAEPAPFTYFTDFKNEAVNKGVREGRKNEITSDAGDGTPPDPTDKEAFLNSKLNTDLMNQGRHCVLWLFYQELIRLRKSIPALSNLDKQNMQVTIDGQGGVMTVHRWHGDHKILAVFNFQDNLADVVLPPGRWQLHLNSGSESWTPEQADPLAAARRETRIITEGIRLGPKTFYLLEHTN